MPHRLEVALKSDLFDAEGDGIRQKAQDYFDIHLEHVRSIQVLTIDAELSESQLNSLKEDIFTNPVTQISSFKPLPIDFDWSIWVGFRPGVRDNPGSTAEEDGFQTTVLPINAGAVGRLPAIEVKLNGVSARTKPSSGRCSI